MILSDYWLVLYPVTTGLFIPAESLVRVLSDNELSGPSLNQDCFAAGEQFLSHICFLGCSPAIELEPQPDKAFCYVRIPAVPLAQLTGHNSKVRRKSVLLARSCIIIGNIYESEAVPEPALLALLEKSTGSAWHYTYMHVSSVTAD
jgi:hypothetical protein